MVKPSMMSVAESAMQEELEDQDEERKSCNNHKDLTSTFKATHKGISLASLYPGKTVHSLDYKNIHNTTINSLDKHLEIMPMPKKIAMAKKKAAAEEKKQKTAADKAEREAMEASGVKMPKKARTNKFAYPTPDPLPPPKAITVTQAMAEAKSWQAANIISNKFSCGTATTAGYAEKTSIFTRMNQKAEEKGSLYPQSVFFGKDPSKKADRFDNREVKNLNDIECEKDSDWEEVRNLKRMPMTILNEENLRAYLSDETLRLNLENHYWISNNMIQTIGRVAPNLMVLSLRRMKFVSNPIFAEVFKYLTKLERVDLTDCDGLLPTATALMIDNNKKMSHLQLSGCTNGVDDEVMENIATLTETLNFLDISYCKQVTDAGLASFTGKTYPLDSLVINGVNGISGPAVKQWLMSFKDTLLDFEAALNDQESFNSCFFEVLGQCWNLETLDVSGSNGIEDDIGRTLPAAGITVGNQPVKPGLQYCHTLKLNGANITGVTLNTISKSIPNLEHIELSKVEGLDEFGVNALLKNCQNVIYLDITSTQVCKYEFLDELKETHPQLLIRRNKHQDDDFKKDNGLRVPRKIIEKKSGKKKKKGKKKK